jgi:tetratricopeptide (TPR) repeat protein
LEPLKWTLSAVAVCMAVMPAPLLAQKSGDASAKARKHYDRAVAYEDAKDWDREIAEYAEANRLYPSAEFDFLIAEVEVKRGNKETAIQRYQSYLAAEPKGRVSQQARDAVEKLRAELATERREAEKRKREAEAGGEKDNPTSGPAPPVDSGANVGEEAASRAPILRASAYIAGGLGLAALTAGLKFGADARNAASDVEERWDPERFEEGKSANQKMKIWCVVGSVGLVSAGVLYYLSHRAHRASTEEPVALTAGPDFIGVVVSGGF